MLDSGNIGVVATNTSSPAGCANKKSKNKAAKKTPTLQRQESGYTGAVAKKTSSPACDAPRRARETRRGGHIFTPE
jgi:hypothetical protein